LAGDAPAAAKAPELALPPRYRPGDVLGGKYRLEGLLGQGGAGDVWLAHNDTLDIDVAVKVIRGAGADSEAAHRLLMEARAAARLGHPAIVRILDFGRAEGGEPFIVMERLIGEDLSAAVKRRGKLSAETAVRTLLPIAHALSVAHGKRIVHRDLKPENIFLAKSEGDRLQPKIVDFGIAQVDVGTSRRETAAGTVLGSPAYMSPEQTRGADVDHRTDVWSFCVVLYETSTGKLPFVARAGGQGTLDHASMLVAIVGEEPPPITELGAGDAALWAILQRGLAKDPDLRFQTIRQVGEALALWLGDKGIKQDITGASLDATWRNGIRGTSLETLNSLPPPANEHTRDSVETVFDAAALASAPLPVQEPLGVASSRAILVVAVLAGIVGIAAGVSLGARSVERGAVGTPKGLPSAVASSGSSTAPAPPSQSAAQSPTSERADPRPNLATAPSATESSKDKERKSVRGGVTRVGKKEAKRPPPALKDPFE
jgi:serine/threonine-protein kinase